MFKLFAFFALLAVVFAAPEPKPGVLAAPLAYTAGYHGYASPLAYSAYSAYSAPAYAAPYAYAHAPVAAAYSAPYYGYY